MGLFGGVEEEPARNARGGAPAPAPASAVAATNAATSAVAATSDGQARQRRGKRD
jgi:hypothetical protein